MDTDFDVDGFLQQPLVAHLATASHDGARESPVWFLWEDQVMWLVGNERDSFLKRLQVDGRCAVGVVEFDLQRGVLKHVGIRGIATILPLDRFRLHRLFRRYLGEDEAMWNPRFRARVIDRLTLMARIEPISVVARDQSYFASTPSA
jgi:Pyridoxamine 5'-phosphate oxidase